MESQPQHLNIMFDPKYAVPVFGYTVPPLALLVMVSNFAMVCTLNKKNMRSPINMLLICIAISNSLTIFLPVIPFVHFYTLGNYKEFVPFAWCRVFFMLVHVIPMLCNMSSLWATVAMAFVRCYSIWRPLHVKLAVTTCRTKIAIVVIYLFSCAVYGPTLFEYSYTPLSVPSLTQPNVTVQTCHMQLSRGHLISGFCAFHTWLQIVCSSLLPWFLITFPDFGMLWKLHKVDSARHTLHDNGGTTTNGRDKDYREASQKCLPGPQSQAIAKKATGRRMTTWFIVVVVTMIWLVEIPYAVSFTMYLAHSNGDVMRNSLGNSMVVLLLIKYITYPIIFLIYCFMSQKFRHAFLEFICIRSSANPHLLNLSQTKSTSSTRTPTQLSGERDS